MKKLPLLFFCVIIILCGCGNADKPPADRFKADFKAVYKDIKLSGKLYSASNNALVVKLSSPDSLNGYVYNYKNDKLSISYKNMNIKSKYNYLPDTDFSKSVYNVLRSLKKENNCKVINSYNSILEYKGRCDSGDYTISAEKGSGIIKNISIKENKLNIKIINAEIIN